MKRNFLLAVLFYSTISCVLTQDDPKDQIAFRGTGEYYIDGFRVYRDLSSNDNIKILKDFVSRLNGCWSIENEVYIFQLSDDTFPEDGVVRGRILQLHSSGWN